MRFDRKTFFDCYRRERGRLTRAQVAALERLIGFIEADPHLTSIRHAAYLLATAGHETAWTFEPIDERGGAAYFNRRYGPQTKVGRTLGNTEAGDGARFHGRGYVQVTGRANSRKLTRALATAYGLTADLEAKPELLKDPQIAYWAASYGMRTGLFTGKKLSDYLNRRVTDYRNARRIINGLDRADDIAGFAREFETILRDAARAAAAPRASVAEAAVERGATRERAPLPDPAPAAAPAESEPSPMVEQPAAEGAAPPESPAPVAQAEMVTKVTAGSGSWIRQLLAWIGGLGALASGHVERALGLDRDVQLALLAIGSVLAVAWMVLRFLAERQIRAIAADPSKVNVK